MSYRSELYFKKNIYHLEGTDELFLNAVKENVRFHQDHCMEYRNILIHNNFSPEQLRQMEDLALLPPIPTSLLKQCTLESIPKRLQLLKSTSSGTSGNKSRIGYDIGGGALGLGMVKTILSEHRLWSKKPVNYLILGYEPSKTNQMVIAKTAYAATLLAPALHKTYALKYKDGAYQIDKKGVLKSLSAYSKSHTPVRIIGFPSYCYFFIQYLQKAKQKIRLPEGSMIFLGGGWKQFSSQQIQKEELYSLIQEYLGVKSENIREFFGVAEHPMTYCACKNHHFHVPVFARVMIRDVNSLAPLDYNKAGILNLITPLLNSMPVTSIMTDDLAVLHEGKECGCGITAPYFEILRRAGLDTIRTCAQGAEQMLGGTRNDID